MDFCGAGDYIFAQRERRHDIKRWEKTTLMSHVCSCIAVLVSNQVFFVCIAVLASNQFFFVCIAVLASNQFFCLYCCVGIQQLNSCLQWWHPPWCSEEGATITVRLRVTCKQLSVLATLVIVFEKLFYHFQFEYQILE